MHVVVKQLEGLAARTLAGKRVRPESWSLTDYANGGLAIYYMTLYDAAMDILRPKAGPCIPCLRRFPDRKTYACACVLYALAEDGPTPKREIETGASADVVREAVAHLVSRGLVGFDHETRVAFLTPSGAETAAMLEPEDVIEHPAIECARRWWYGEPASITVVDVSTALGCPVDELSGFAHRVETRNQAHEEAA